MTKHHYLFLLATTFAVLLLSSCRTSREEFVYLNDMRVGTSYPFDDTYEATIHSNDRLSITVSCKNPELAIPFNIYDGTFRVSSSGNITAGTSDAEKEGYRVDVAGHIEFPILGTLHVSGMTVSQASNMIARKIEDGGYMKDPIVSIEFLNFKYTMLGAVSRNGTFTVKGDRITLLEAIAQAGNLASNARMDRVMVIREVDGQRQVYAHDLRSKAIFDSPCFYLKQNDIVYVEPKYISKENETRGWQIAGMAVSVASLICSVLWIVYK